jgi:hypothetical protein
LIQPEGGYNQLGIEVVSEEQMRLEVRKFDAGAYSLILPIRMSFFVSDGEVA